MTSKVDDSIGRVREKILDIYNYDHAYADGCTLHDDDVWLNSDLQIILNEIQRLQNKKTEWPYDGFKEDVAIMVIYSGVIAGILCALIFMCSIHEGLK